MAIAQVSTRGEHGTTGTVPVSLDTVLRSVDMHHPQLLAARVTQQAAEHRRRKAQGKFDVQLAASGGGFRGGKYDATQFGIKLSQKTPLQGLSWSLGYNNGWDYPVYAAKGETSEFGELFAELKQPLLAGRSTDGARTERNLAELKKVAAAQELGAARIALRFEATRTYLEWLRAGAQYSIAQRLVKLALARRAGIDAQIESGALPALEAVDNNRLIATRREKLVFARQGLAQVALKLGLFLRQESGKPAPPPLTRVPRGFPETLQSLLSVEERTSANTLGARPDLRLYRTALRALRRKLAYSANRAEPSLNANAKVVSSMGTERSYAPFATTEPGTRVMVGLEFRVPLQGRQALGEAAALRSDIAALQYQSQLALEKAQVELEQAWQVLEGARARRGFAKKARDAASIMEEAERQRFADGLSSVLTVNLREAASAGSKSRLVVAQYDYYLALARYRAAGALL